MRDGMGCAILLLFLALVTCGRGSDAADRTARPVVSQVEAAAAGPKVVAAPAAAPEPEVIPADPIARAKFRHSRPREVDLLAYVNTFVNSRITGTDDEGHYGIGDYWVMAPADGKGDCEDYALTKIFVLEQYDGVALVQNVKLVGVLHHDAPGDDGVGHLILAVRLTGGAVAYLDNNFPGLMTRAELVKAGYEFFDWKA